MKRRTFISTVLGTLFTSVAFISFNKEINKQTSKLLTRWIRAYFPPEIDINVIANNYISQSIAEKNKLHLIDELNLINKHPLKADSINKKNIQSLYTRIEKEFEHDDTLLIDGWVLSRTEVQLCTLVSSA